MTKPMVFVVILAWNHKDLTLECIESFMSINYPNFRIVVVDNGSTDGTYQTVANRFTNIRILRSDQNLGIAGGYNLGIKMALESEADYVLVTNNDVIVDSSLLTHLVGVMENHTEVGMTMPKIYHFYGDTNRLWCTGGKWRKFPPGVTMTGYGVKDSEQWSSLQEIDFAPSCTLLIHKEALSELGGFDERYFYYNDDWDFSNRLRNAGYKILFVPDAKIWHKVSASTQNSDKPAYWWEVMGCSSVIFYLNHRNLFELIVFVVWFVIRESLKLKVKRIPPFLKGISSGFSTILT
jgi:hypothetical protein